MSRHLKEDDDFICHLLQQIRELSPHPTPEGIRGVFAAAQAQLAEHRAAPDASTLRKISPAVGRVFAPLDLVGALDDLDSLTKFTRRRRVPPTFREVRQVLNIAAARAAGSQPLKLVCLDADDTIYSDGGTLDVASPMIPLICRLLTMGVHVALVTAAGYPGQPWKYELRLSGLLRALAFAIECGANPDIVTRFHIMGGECNYLLETGVSLGIDGLNPRVFFKEVPDEDWKDGRGVRWDHGDVTTLLNEAEACLREMASHLGLDVLIIRKERAVGLIPNPNPSASSGGSGAGGSGNGIGGGATDGAGAASSPSTAAQQRPVFVSPVRLPALRRLPGAYGGGPRISYEILEEVAFAVQERLREKGITIPHCAFNGGADVFVDVGAKDLGVRALQVRVGAKPEETLHCGDRFSRTGNDLRTRDVAQTLWVESPLETEYLLSIVIHDLRRARVVGDSGGDSGGLSPELLDAALLGAADVAPGGMPVVGGAVSVAAALEAAAVAASSSAAATAAAPPAPASSSSSSTSDSSSAAGDSPAAVYEVIRTPLPSGFAAPGHGVGDASGGIVTAANGLSTAALAELYAPPLGASIGEAAASADGGPPPLSLSGSSGEDAATGGAALGGGRRGSYPRADLPPLIVSRGPSDTSYSSWFRTATPSAANTPAASPTRGGGGGGGSTALEALASASGGGGGGAASLSSLSSDGFGVSLHPAGRRAESGSSHHHHHHHHGAAVVRPAVHGITPNGGAVEYGWMGAGGGVGGSGVGGRLPESELLLKESQWASAGGVVVGEVSGGRATPRSTPPTPHAGGERGRHSHHSNSRRHSLPQGDGTTGAAAAPPSSSTTPQ